MTDTGCAGASPFPPGQDPNYDLPAGAALDIPSDQEVTGVKPDLSASALDVAAPSAGACFSLCAANSPRVLTLPCCRCVLASCLCRSHAHVRRSSSLLGTETGHSWHRNWSLLAPTSTLWAHELDTLCTKFSHSGHSTFQVLTENGCAAGASPFPPGQDPNYDLPSGDALDIPSGQEVTGVKPDLPSPALPTADAAAALPALDAPALPTADAALPTADKALPAVDAALPTADVDASLPKVDAALPTVGAALPTAAGDAALPTLDAKSPFPAGQDPNYDLPAGGALDIPSGQEVAGDKPMLPSAVADAALPTGAPRC